MALRVDWEGVFPKPCGSIAGRGSLVTQQPRLPLEGAEEAEVERLMRVALATRPMPAAA
jgi:hypothetical protein